MFFILKFARFLKKVEIQLDLTIYLQLHQH